MSIMFDKGDGSKDPKGRQGWLKDSHDHLTSEVTVTRLIQKAAKALERVEIIEVQIWCSAAWGVADSGVLRVYKGLHTMQGYRRDEMHITMDMKIPGSEQHSLVEYSLFAGAFHLKAKIEGPRPTKGGYEIRPVELSYQVVPKPATRDFIRVPIPNSGAVSSELRP
ncbi:MAG: hypothetical protein WBX22_29640 [Silvibacterium sp.]